MDGAPPRLCRAGLDVENGLHVFLGDDPELRALAEERGVELRDLRRPPADLSTATGENLGVDATIVLTVGSDCAIGKMTVSCELDLEARRRGLRSVFVPTGQTGIAIAGWGIAVDAVVSDFLAGAAERLVVEGRARGGDMLWIEGQGRSCTRSTPASRSACITAASRTCSSSATKWGGPRSRAQAAGRTRFLR